MTLSKETLEEIAELARKATYKPCAMHITNLVARCDSEVVEELIRELLERRERDKQEPVAWRKFVPCEWNNMLDTYQYFDAPGKPGEREPLYAAPSAPVVPTFEEWCQRNEQKPVGWVRDAMKEAYDGCRTAALDQTHVKQPASNGQSFGNSEQLPEHVADVVTWRKEGQERICDIRWRRFDVAPGPLFTQPLPPGVPDGYCIMPLKLTAANGAKAALSGEFHVNHHIVCEECAGEGCESCNEEGGWEGEIPIGWDTIKRIHEAAVETCALPKSDNIG